MQARVVAALVAAGMLTSAAGEGQEMPLRAVRVRVYDASLTTEARRSALETASSKVATASIRVIWTDCSISTSDARCLDPLSDELIVRILKSAPPLTAGGHRRRDARLTLGDAYVDPVSGSGVLATVYLERVRLLAEAVNVQMPTLLGDAIAHELGHLLMSSTAHAPRGLMRSVWLPAEIQDALPGDWSFTADDILAIRARLESAGGTK